MSDTKTALLDTAEQAARARGFDGFSYADLAEAVGIRKASIHYHFPTKSSLSEALMERYQETLTAACEAIDEREGTGADRLRALIAIYRNALNNGKTLCLCVSFIASRESLSDDVLNKINAFRKRMIDWIGKAFELGQKDGSITGVVEANLEAKSMMAQLEGAHLAARAQENVAAFDAAMEVLLSRFWDK